MGQQKGLPPGDQNTLRAPNSETSGAAIHDVLWKPAPDLD